MGRFFFILIISWLVSYPETEWCDLYSSHRVWNADHEWLFP